MRIVFIGITLFALFFGAGNLIFPVSIGQASGQHFGLASLGFVVTGVILPLLGVIALGFSGEKDFLKITQRGGKIFGLIFATTLYLTIGPLFAMPRTGTVSYEIAIKPFVNPDDNTLFLAIFTFFYFAICCVFSINPNKIIDIVGKILTPLMLIFILILIVVAIISPMGNILPPITQDYQNYPFFKGFTDGYQTMDTLASFIFGIIVIYSIVNLGIKNKSQIMLACIKSSLIAASILALVYISLTYIGASSVAKIGLQENGGLVLAKVSTNYFGIWGNLILGIIVTMACMTTCIGLINACASYLVSIFPQLSYRQYAVIFSIISALFANVGLSALISFSVPVLSIIYPATITLIFLTFTNNLFKGKKAVYAGAIYGALLISVLQQLLILLKLLPTAHSDLTKNIVSSSHHINNFLNNYLPLYNVDVGWLIPAIIGGIAGYVYTKWNANNNHTQIESNNHV